jgi:hypothetical protein
MNMQMFAYPYPSVMVGEDTNYRIEHSSDAHNPEWAWVPMVPVLVPVWNYPQPEFKVEEPRAFETSPAADTVEAPASCTASADNSDSYSDASTDVGDDDDDDQDLVDDQEEEAGPESKDVEPERRTSCFCIRLSRDQRVKQLEKVVDEFCSLDFNSVDASSQGAVALRMLTILKSMDESTTFYESDGRTSETRLSLLGLCQDGQKAVKAVTTKAEGLCNSRLFRAAFDVLRQAAPLLHRSAASVPGKATHQELQAITLPGEMTTEELAAMKQRRLEKRQRQREERREQREVARTERSVQRAQQYKSKRQTGVSSVW